MNSLPLSIAMQDSRFPVELCELVIDFVPCQWSYRWYEGHWWWSSKPWELVRLMSICSAWLPRARIVLYDTVVFKRPSQVDLFLRSITETPHLADMVHRLVISPDDDLKDNYIPFVHYTLTSRLQYLESLAYIGMDFRNHPSHHHVLVSQLPIRTLIVNSVHNVMSVVELFRIVWSLRHLQTLDIHMGWIKRRDVDMRHLNALRRSWACSKLRTLRLNVSPQLCLVVLCLTHVIPMPAALRTVSTFRSVRLARPLAGLLSIGHPVRHAI